MNFQTKLQRLDACPEAIDWAKDYKTFKEAWNDCERSDWMLWIAGELADKNGNRKEFVLCTCKIARTFLKYLPKDEKRPLECIKTVEKWTKGKATMEEVRKARRAAVTAYTDIYVVASIEAVNVAVAAAVSVAIAANVNGYFCVGDTRAKTQKKLANIVRKNLNPPLK